MQLLGEGLRGLLEDISGQMKELSEDTKLMVGSWSELIRKLMQLE